MRLRGIQGPRYNRIGIEAVKGGQSTLKGFTTPGIVTADEADKLILPTGKRKSSGVDAEESVQAG